MIGNLLSIPISFLLGAIGRRVAGGYFETLTGLKWGQPTRLFFGLTICISVILAGAPILPSLLLIPAIWFGTIVGLFGGLGMGRGEHGDITTSGKYWRDFFAMGLHGFLGIIFPAIWCVWMGYNPIYTVIAGILCPVWYEIGYRIIGKPVENGGLIRWRTGLNPQPTPFNRQNWPIGFSGAPEIGELIYGGIKAVGMVLSVLLL
jgi:hypothetical protein